LIFLDKTVFFQDKKANKNITIFNNM
jgi:hypothetical protein